MDALSFFNCFSANFFCSSSSSISASDFLFNSANCSAFYYSNSSFSCFFLAIRIFSSCSSSLFVFSYLTWFINDLISEREASSLSRTLIYSWVFLRISAASFYSAVFFLSVALAIALSSLDVEPSDSVWTLESSSSESSLSDSSLELSCLWCLWCFLWCFFSFFTFLFSNWSAKD